MALFHSAFGPDTDIDPKTVPVNNPYVIKVKWMALCNKCNKCF